MARIEEANYLLSGPLLVGWTSRPAPPMASTASCSEAKRREAQAASMADPSRTDSGWRGTTTGVSVASATVVMNNRLLASPPHSSRQPMGAPRCRSESMMWRVPYCNPLSRHSGEKSIQKNKHLRRVRDRTSW